MRRALPTALAALVLLTPALAVAQTPADDGSSTEAPSDSQPTDAPPPKRLLTPQQEGRQGMVKGVVEQPLRDFNLVRSRIPPILLEARADAYAKPAGGCEALAAEIEGLDAAVGADLDQPVVVVKPSMATRGKSAARTGALDAMRTGVQSYIPFDGYIRLVTGADRHDHLVMEAIQAGAIRRAYLKGLGEAHGCPSPAAPRHLAHPVSVADAKP